MGLRLTPQILEAAYDFLRALPPFSGWRLPVGDEIEFRVTRATDYSGLCHRDRWCITLSDAKHGHLITLLITMAHEMLHLRQILRGEDRPDVEHNEAFKRTARRISEIHGFDPQAF